MNSARSINWWRPDAGLTVPAASPASGGVAFRALIAYTVILVAAPQEFVAPLKPLRLALLAAIVAMAAYAGDRLTTPTRAPLAREVWLTGALVVWAVAMVPLSYWPGGSVSMLLELYLKSVAMFVLLAGVVDTPARLRTVAWTLAACVVPIALTALSHYRSGVFMPAAPGRIAGYGTSGLAGNPNDLALLLNLVVPLLVALAMSTRLTTVRIAALAVLLLSIAGIVVTFSRSGFLTLATTALVYLWRLARRGRIGLVATILAIVGLVIVLAPAGYGARLMTVSNIDTDPTGSAQNRWRDTVVATEFVVGHPIIGAGPGMDFLALNDLRGAAWLNVHDAYLNYAVDLGLPGLVMFLVLFGWSIGAALEAERVSARNRDDDMARMAAAIRISLLAFAVAAFFYPVAYHAYFYYVAGLAVAARGIARREAACRQRMAGVRA